MGGTSLFAPLLAAFCLAWPAGAVEVRVHHLTVEVPPPPILSELETRPEGLGADGARLGRDDNATTGRFLGQTYELEVSTVDVDGDIAAAARAALAETPFLIVDGPTEALLAIADLPEAQGALIFNVSEGDPALRDASCRANLLHTVPSTAMRTDALAQFLVLRRWDDLVLVEGEHAADAAYAAALERSLAKFGLRLSDRKTWAFDADMRRNANAEVPLFTQGFGDYDALLVADELGDFGRYLLYNTWEPRPVAGSEGLTAQTWAPVVEQWGAVQLQNRFTELADRGMEPVDWAAWAATRSIGEAVTRTGAADPAAIRAFLLSDAFELAGFKGRPLTFRAWNGQLRQPIPLVHPRALVASAPLEGFLHQRTELDTLGLDEPESACTAFR
ncbi:ABC transporter substrate-binding protein [Jannaschia formosa]|uniref:ABC transporter substrate-binding protein n=1 Tax=Jannaschia formosa TaxID=2259592 RepID=UPI000E1B61D9|nr:ABC transporter substrate-binding protein [Jannaschia formosa]TFL16676.1 branched-chain amino acid ABC transporter substrate-binding protein [Jannaschia formosa]